MFCNQTNTKAHGNSMSATESAANDPALLKRQQLARAINVSSRTVSNWQSSGKIPFIKPSERCVRFHLPSVLAALWKFEVKALRS
jgi:hypothetical protein